MARRTRRPLGLSLLSVFFAALLGAPSAAVGVPKERDTAPNARIEDADGKALELSSLKGKPVLIVYDDRSSAPKSEAFRKDIVKLLKGAPYASTVKLLVVANVSSFDFWPARGTVQDAVRKETQKQGTTVYCDWSGGLHKAYKMKDDVTGVVLIGKDAKVRYAFEGIPTGTEKKRLVDALSAEAEAP